MKFQIDHDLHCHSRQSLCSGDPTMTPQTILQHAKCAGYNTQCITNHYWDESIPMWDSWYQQQNTPHVKEDLPLFPKETDGVRLLLGCETELAEGDILGISPEKYDDFSFIVIPPNHLHLKNVTCPNAERTVENFVKLYTHRLEVISKMDLPWQKIGIAHLNFLYEGDISRQVMEQMDQEELTEIFKRFAQKGAGIELNASAFAKWGDYKESHLRLFKIAREAGCKFYCGSDAHQVVNLTAPEKSLETILRPVVDALELTEKDKFILK